jgi:hypothetical protein
LCAPRITARRDEENKEGGDKEDGMAQKIELLKNPMFSRGVERIIINLGAILMTYLGYKLFIFGIEKGYAELTAETKFYKIVFSGTGPGLFFMAFGAIVLITALLTRTTTLEDKTEDTTKGSAKRTKIIRHKVTRRAAAKKRKR